MSEPLEVAGFRDVAVPILSDVLLFFRARGRCVDRNGKLRVCVVELLKNSWSIGLLCFEEIREKLHGDSMLVLNEFAFDL
jgi:hypothetical protein